ncbi:MAG: hypothetical protein HQ588_06840 [Deltaproteobacteria bacterium]|nr:hypothetical protein [Deltaproteobacteria bacterium]
MEQVKTEQGSGLGKLKLGLEWEAGGTPPGDSAPGQWAVARRVRDWAVLFRSAKGAEYVVHTFPLTEAGERAAKTMAAKLVDVAWGKGTMVEKTKADRKQEETSS